MRRGAPSPWRLPHHGLARATPTDRAVPHLRAGVARLAAELERSDRRFRSIVERTTDGVLVVDERGSVLFANSAAEKTLGRPRERIIGRSFGFPVVANDTTELELVRPGGAVGYAEMSVIASEWDGSPALLVLLHDITDRRAAELDMIRMNAELSRSNAELEAFAGVVAHDLKQPIAAVTAALDALATSSPSSGGGELAASAMGTLSDMARLVDAVLAYATAGSAPLRWAVLDCGAVVRRCAADLSPEGSVGIRPLPIVRADPVLLRQIFQNLISNGLRYRRPDVEPRVEVSSLRVANGWQFEVADNGRGISPEDVGRVFDPFWRPAATREAGHGIGMAACQRAVARLGGSIWIADTSPAGTRVRFTLPEI